MIKSWGKAFQAFCLGQGSTNNGKIINFIDITDSIALHYIVTLESYDLTLPLISREILF